MIKGQARFVFTDVETGEVTKEFTEDNFIFFDQYQGLWTANTQITRVYIVSRGSSVYPRFARYRPYFGSLGGNEYLSGYAPTGTQLKRFYQKTDDSPAYWEFYSLFLPPATTLPISCVALSSFNSAGDNALAGPWGSGAFDGQFTAINLNPPCYQSPTEYLNVYYRLIMLEDEEDDVPDYIKNQFVMDIDRGSSQLLYPNDAFTMYPYRIGETTTKNGKLNFLSEFATSLPTKQTIVPTGLNGSMWAARKNRTWPDDVPNQYNQIQGWTLKTLMRGGKTRLSGMSSYIHPESFVPEIGEGISGIGNVFPTSSGSNSAFFDAAFFPLGSGKMYASGQWEPEPQRKRIVVEIQETGQYANDATYRIFKYHHTVDVALPLLPNIDIYNSSWSVADYESYFYNGVKNAMYREPEKIHFSNMMRTWIEERAFITWDSTGITIYDIYLGTLTPFDSTTTPPLTVNDIRDVKVDTNGNIWVACGNTGLWRIRIEAEEVTMTHIGIFPASQQRCYAIDVDNFGNIWGVFWGQGLYYSIDGGENWVNAIIDYAPFSEFDEEMSNSQWRHCSRLICNPHRNASQNDGQVLILTRTNSLIGGATAGCWYDQQSADVVGITHSTLRSELTRVRNDGPRENVAVSSLTDKWLFNSLSGGIRVINFLQNAAATAITGNTVGTTPFYTCHIETLYDPVAGVYKDYAYNGPFLPHSTSNISNAIIDVATNNVIKFGRPATSQNGWQWSLGAATNAVRFGRNLYITYEHRSLPSPLNRRLGFYTRFNHITTKEYRQWTADNYGWGGGTWVKDYLGNKTCHLTPEPFERGINVQFENGPLSTTSFVQGDQYTFTCFDGFYKDNASKMNLMDTVYFKPKQEVSTFEPPVVTLVNRSADTGLLVNADINQDWNLDQLPDTIYDGTPLVLDGDHLYSYVTYLNHLSTSGTPDLRFNAVATVTGTVAPSFEQPYNDAATTYFNGESGLTYAANANYGFGSGNFTLEGFYMFEELGTTVRVLFDTRTATTGVAGVGLFYVTADSKLAFWNGVTYGNTGPALQPGQWYHIQFSRSGNTWSAAVNGIVYWTFELSLAFAASSPLHICKEWAQGGGTWRGFKGWASNIRITKTHDRYVGNHPIPATPLKNYSNSFSGARLKFPGFYNEGGIVSKKELVGNWTVMFRNIPTNLMSLNNSRPRLTFGISTTNKITTITDIGYRVIADASATDWWRIENWLEVWGGGQPFGTADVRWWKYNFAATLFRFQKVGEYITIHTSTDNGVTWTWRAEWMDHAPLHYIAMYQIQPITDMIGPAVEITQNGSAYFSKVGDSFLASGIYHPRFLAADGYWEHDYQIQLDGVPSTKNRSNYEAPALPLEGEVYLHQHGTLRFHPADAGKAITGKVVCIRE